MHTVHPRPTMPAVTILSDGSPRLLSRADVVKRYRGQVLSNDMVRAETTGPRMASTGAVGNRLGLSVADVLEIRVRYRETGEPVDRIAVDFRITPAMVEAVGRAIAFDDRERGIVAGTFGRE